MAASRAGSEAGLDKPFSEACERNRGPILEVLREHLGGRRRVLEIGSGSGQHAVHFAAALPALTWQASDVAAHLPGIRAWLDDAGLPNTPPPLLLDVDGTWPGEEFDAAFSANTLHIMGWAQVQAMFAMLNDVLADDATVVIYGPFNYGGRFTSASNAAFDANLKARDARMGIRDFQAVNLLAGQAGLALLEDRAMPANNRCLVWGRSARPGTPAPRKSGGPAPT